MIYIIVLSLVDFIGANIGLCVMFIDLLQDCKASMRDLSIKIMQHFDKPVTILNSLVSKLDSVWMVLGTIKHSFPCSPSAGKDIFVKQGKEMGKTEPLETSSSAPKRFSKMSLDIFCFVFCMSLGMASAWMLTMAAVCVIMIGLVDFIGFFIVSVISCTSIFSWFRDAIHLSLTIITVTVTIIFSCWVADLTELVVLDSHVMISQSTLIFSRVGGQIWSNRRRPPPAAKAGALAERKASSHKWQEAEAQAQDAKAAKKATRTKSPGANKVCCGFVEEPQLFAKSPDADVQTKAPPAKPRGGARALAAALPALLLALPAAVAQPDMVELCALNPPSQAPGLYEGATRVWNYERQAYGYTVPPNAACRWTAGGDPADNLDSDGDL